MQKSSIILDLFVTIVDNYGDMGFAIEFFQSISREYGDIFHCITWTNKVHEMRIFVEKSGIRNITISDIDVFGRLRKSTVGISLLHSPIPDRYHFSQKSLVLRIDYLSLDPLWITNNEKEYIDSNPGHRIIELIPSPMASSAGLVKKQNYIDSRKKPSGRHIVIFAYPSTLPLIDWDSFPGDMEVFVFGKTDSLRKNVISLDFLPTFDFYNILDTSEFAIIRGEVTFAHMIQTGIPLLWDMYKDIGGFPESQSEQFLSFIEADDAYRCIHTILNGQKSGKITYANMVQALSGNHFPERHTPNLIHTVKKHIDRFYNSI